jgi:hypothetical protein
MHGTLCALGRATKRLRRLSDQRDRLNAPSVERTLAGMQIIDIHMSMRSAVDDAIARTVAIGALVAIAIIHVLQLPVAFAEIGYLGALFIAAAAASLALAAVMTRTSDDRVWGAAGGLAGLILLGYVISRSVGLPGFTGDTGDWSEAPGLASMVVESLLVFLTAAVLVTRRMPVRSASGSAASTSATASGMQPGPAVG